MDWLDAWKIADHPAMRATRAAAAKSLLRDLANALFREGMASTCSRHACEA